MAKEMRLICMFRNNNIIQQALHENAGITNSLQTQNIPMPRKLEHNQLKIKSPEPILPQIHQHASLNIVCASQSTPCSFSCRSVHTCTRNSKLVYTVKANKTPWVEANFFVIS